MKNYTYIIIGGGMTSFAAVQGIREVDGTGSIALFSNELVPPYKKPPLSKGLWQKTPVEKIWFDLSDGNIDLFTDTMIESVDVLKKEVSTNQGESYRYEKLLLATGAESKVLPFSDKEIIYYRNFSDYERLKSLVGKHNQFVIIGAGFIGSEIAAALAMNGKDVMLLESQQGIGWKVFPADVVEHLNAYYREKGVKVLDQVSIKEIERQNGFHRIILNDGKTIKTEVVIAGIGVSPMVDLANGIDLQEKDGIKVNMYLETSTPDIFAAGDVAVFHSAALDQDIRVEHEDNALTMGKVAGRNMAGANEEYDHLPMFYSDLFDIGYEAVGLIDSRLQVEAVWEEKYQKGILVYVQDDLIKGVLLWNVWGKVDEARKLIRDQREFSQAEIEALLKE